LKKAPAERINNGKARIDSSESLGTVVSSRGNWHTYRVVLSTFNATDVKVELFIDGVLKTTQTGSNFIGQTYIALTNTTST
jgi:hypothetical protein